MRFEGQMNVDINEIAMNSCPFPQLKLLIPALAPPPPPSAPPIPSKTLKKWYENQFSLIQISRSSQDQILGQVLHHKNQLVKCNPLANVFIACSVV